MEWTASSSHAGKMALYGLTGQAWVDQYLHRKKILHQPITRRDRLFQLMYDPSSSWNGLCFAALSTMLVIGASLVFAIRSLESSKNGGICHALAVGPLHDPGYDPLTL